MVKRIIIFGILGSFIQVLVYYALIILFWSIAKIFYNPKCTDIGWGLTIQYSVYVFFVILLIQNILIEVKNKYNLLKYFYFISIFVFILSVQNIKHFPYKSILLFLAGIITLSLKFYLDCKRNKS